jgi:hypothetical protein
MDCPHNYAPNHVNALHLITPVPNATIWNEKCMPSFSLIKIFLRDENIAQWYSIFQHEESTEFHSVNSYYGIMKVLRNCFAKSTGILLGPTNVQVLTKSRTKARRSCFHIVFAVSCSHYHSYFAALESRKYMTDW